MARSTAVGIDIGTYQVKVVVSEVSKERPTPKVTGIGFSESRGLRHGYIINQTETVKSIRTAVAQAEKMSGIKIKRAVVSIGGIGLASYIGQSSVITSKADSEITDLDIKRVHENCENDLPIQITANRKIIHSIPLQYKIDGKAVIGRPQGMRGAKLDVKMLFITCLEQHLHDLAETIDNAGIEIEDIVASPIAASLVVLNKQQKMAGCVLANIGSETVSIVVYEEDRPISLEVFPIGSTDITNDIALGLKISLEEAEQIKIGTLSDDRVSKKKLEEIVTARLSDIFDLIEAHLKKIGKNGLLPAGIIMTGGGSSITTIEDFAKAVLKLPSKIGTIKLGENARDFVKDATWSVAYGLSIVGLTMDEYNPSVGILSRHPKGLVDSVVNWFKWMMP